jgi:acyl-homoserine-lactone acylase
MSLPLSSSVRVRLIGVLLAAAAAGCAGSASTRPGAAPAAAGGDELARRAAHAAHVTITRDDWGIPHIKGTTDADAVFGVIYAQAEDDFNRIELNYLTALGRRAEAEGEVAVWRDVRQRLFVHEDSLRAQYAKSPQWLRALMQAWADGLNHYLATHPDVRPAVLTRFEPWMPLAFSEGSIGGDIERISTDGLRAFYGEGMAQTRVSIDPASGVPVEPQGSNGIAIAPSRSAGGHALLLINPHTSFYFRAEAQMTSGEGLNAYGAMTWGQFFIYQGFNGRVGWMHTSSTADVVDEWAEQVTPRGSGWTYRHAGADRPVLEVPITLRVRTASGLETRTVRTFRTHHGPIVRRDGDRWISVGLMWRPVEALQQSYLRTKATTFAEYRRIMGLRANSSNNTVYADADGTVGLFLPDFIPQRDDRFDWTRPVDGTTAETDWQGMHALESIPHVHNPGPGWIQNTNNGPWTSAGTASPSRTAYPSYMDREGENPRGVHAVRLLQDAAPLTADGLQRLAYDSYLTAFDDVLPPLFRAYDALPGDAAARADLADAIALLRAWDRRWDTASVATSVAHFWAEELWRRGSREPQRGRGPLWTYLTERQPDAERLAALAATLDTMTQRFGTWRTPWGAINRFQRRTGDIEQPFLDAAPSTAVPFTSSRWGSLASFGTVTPRGQTKLYGVNGNSFVAVVEFGPRVRARAVMAGGQHGIAGTKHFDDQIARYAAGALRPVYFHPDELEGHVERRYQPGR